MEIKILLLFFFGVYFSSADQPEDGNSCSRKVCEDIGIKFHYEKGKTYIYEYKTQISTSMNGVTNDSAMMNMTAEVHIDVLSPCEFSLKIENVNFDRQYENEPGAYSFLRSLMDNKIRFGFHDGLITDLCPTSINELREIINFKRGIISLLQNTMENYNRQQFIDETNESLPLLQEHQTCKQIISKGIMKEVSCEEHHLLIPFSGSNETGSQTEVYQSLLFKMKKDSTENVVKGITLWSNLIFDHFFTPGWDLAIKKNPNEILSQFCKQINKNIQPETPQMFISLINDLRKLNSIELQQIYDDIYTNCQDNFVKLRNIYLDAVHYVNTENAFKFMTHIILKKKISATRVNSWIFSLSLQSFPTSGMIEAVLPLLDAHDAPPTIFLGISSLVHTYCQSHPECKLENEVQQVIRKLDAMLHGKCLFLNSTDAQKILMALKAIGNIGFMLPSVEHCYKNNIPSKIRIAAVEAFRRVSCDISREDVFNLYLDEHEKSEVRIAALLEVMRCPSPYHIMKIHDTLNKEPINQVGSFTWSYLTNIQESSDPCKAYIKGLLADLELQKKFSSDFRKFSQAFEKSFFSEALNAGAHVDGNVIFSTDSYVPISGKVNLTVDLFGRSINLFEFSGALQGLESIIENYFGSRKLNPEKNVQTAREKKIDESKLQTLANKYTREASYFDEPSLSGSIKIFGNELQYWSMQGEKSMRDLQDLLNLRKIIASLAENQNLQLRRDMILLDSHFTVPTGAGFPLTLSLNSSASIKLNIAGKLDLQNLSVQGFNIGGYIHPSAAVIIDGKMQVDFHIASVGIHFHSTLHTSTYIDGNFEVKGKHDLQLQVNVPENKMEFINIKNRIYMLKNKKKYEVFGIMKDRTDFHKCSGEHLTKLFGVEICGTLRYSNASEIAYAPSFPFTGPFDAKLLLSKTDPTLTHYIFGYKWEKKQITQSNHMENFLLTFKTPRSKENREITIEYIMNQPEQSVTFRFVTPIKKFTLDGKYSNDDYKKNFDAIVTVDETNYTINADVQIENTETVTEIFPKLYILSTEGPVLSLTGFIRLEIENKLTVNLLLEHLSRKPLSLSGEIIRLEKDNVRQLQWNLNFTSPILDAKVTGYVSGDGHSMTITLKIDYSWMGRPNETIEFLMKFFNSSPSSRTHRRLAVTADLKISAFPTYNTAISWIFITRVGHLENNLEIGFGPDADANESKLRLEQILSYEGTIQNSTLRGSFLVLYPKRDIDFSFRLIHHSSQHLVYSQISLRLDPQKEYEINANFSDESKKFANVTAELEFKIPSRTIFLKVKLTEERRSSYCLNALVQWDKGRPLILQAFYHDNSTRVQLSYNLKANLTMPSNVTHNFYGRFFAAANNISSNAIFIIYGKKFGIEANLTRVRRNNYQLRSFVVWRDFIYTCNGNLTLGGKTLLSLNFDLGNNRIITVWSLIRNLEHLQTYTINIFWNIYGENKTMVIHVENRKPHAGEHKVEFKLEHPDFHLVVRFNNQKQGFFQYGHYNHVMNLEIEWDRNQQIIFQGEVYQTIQDDKTYYKRFISIQTPFTSIEKMEASVESISDDMNWDLQFVLKWPESKRIQIFLNITFGLNGFAEQSKLTLELITPFDGFENISIIAWQLEHESEFQGGLQIHWSKTQQLIFSFHMKGSINESVIMGGGFNLSSPWPGLQYLSAQYQHIHFKNYIDSFIEIIYEHHPKLKLSISGNYTIEDNFQWKGKMQLYLPFEDYQDIEITMNHLINASAIYSHTTVFWSSKPNINVTFILLKQKTKQGQTLNFNINFETPFHGLDQFQIRTKLTYAQLYINTYVYIQWPQGKQLNISLYGIGQSDGCKGQLLLITPWDGYKNLNVTLKFLLQEKHVNIFLGFSNQINHFTFQIFGICKNCDSNSYEVEIQIALILPFKVLNCLELYLLHKHHDVTSETKAKLQYNEYQINGTHQLNLTNWLNFYSSLLIETSHNLMDTVNFTLNQQYMKNFFNHHFLIEWGRNKKIQGEALFTQESSSSKQHSIHGKLQFSSPFSKFNNLWGNILYQRNEQNYSIQCNIQYQQEIINLNAWAVFSLSAFSFDFNFISPFTGYEDLMIKGNLQTGSQIIPISAQLTIQWAPNKNIIASLLMNFGWPNPMIRILVTTPYEMLNSLELHGRQISTSDGNTVIFVYRRNEEVVDLSVSWISRISYFKLDVVLKTSYYNIDTVNFTFKKDFSKARKEMLMNVKWPSDQFSAEAKVEFISWNSFSGNIDVQSRYRMFEILIGEFHFEQNENAYEGRASIQGKEPFKIELFVNLKFDPRTVIPLEIAVNLLTPTQLIERYKIFCSITKKNHKTIITGSIEWNNNKLEISTETTSRNNYLEFSIKSSTSVQNNKILETSCYFLNDNYNIIKGNLMIKPLFETVPVLKLSICLQWDGRYLIKGDFLLESSIVFTNVSYEYKNLQSVDIKGNIHIPTTVLKNVTFETHFQKTASYSYKADGVFTISNMKYSISGTFDNFPYNTFSGNLEFVLPPATHKLMITLIFDKKADQTFEIKVNTTKDDNSLNQFAHIKINNFSGLMQFYIESSFSEFKKILILLSIKLDEEHKEIYFEITKNEETLSSIITIKNPNWSDLLVTVILNTPFKTFEHARLHGRLKRTGWLNVEAELDLTSSLQQFSSMGINVHIFQLRDHSFNFSIQTRMPSKNASSLSLRGEILYNNDFTRFQSRFILFFPNKIFDISGSMKRIPGKVELEFKLELEPNMKFEASTIFLYRLNFADIVIKFISSIEGFENVRFSAKYYVNKNDEHMILVEARYPKSTWLLSGILKTKSLPNFNIDIQIQSPIRGFENVSIKLEQYLTFQSYFGMLQCYWSENKKFLFHVNHVFESIIKRGRIEIVTPFPVLRNEHLTYRFHNDSTVYELFGSFVHDDKKLLELHFISDEKITSSDNEISNYKFYFHNPFQPFGLSASIEILNKNEAFYLGKVIWDLENEINSSLSIEIKLQESDALYEVAVRTIHANRIMTFVSESSNKLKMFTHNVSFTWDQESNKTINCKIINEDQSTGDTIQYKVFIIIDHFLRNIEWQGNFSSIAQNFSIGTKLLWDASRNRSKCIDVTLHHHNQKNGNEIKYINELLFFRSNSEKMAVLRGDVIVSDKKEFFSIYAEADYSKDENKKFTFFFNLRNESNNLNIDDFHYHFVSEIKHLISGLFVNCTGEIADTLHMKTILGNITFLKLDGKKVEYCLKGIMQRPHFAQLELVSPSKILKTSIHTNTENETYLFNITHQENGANKFILDFWSRPQTLDADLQLFYLSKEYNSLSAKSGFETDRSFIFHIYRNLASKKTEDILMTMKLISPYLFTLQMMWKTDFFFQIKEYARDITYILINEMKDQWNDMKNGLMEEAGYIFNKIFQAAQKVILSLVSDLVAEVETILTKDFQLIKTIFKNMYEANEFHLKDIISWSSEIQIKISDLYKQLLKNVELFHNQMKEELKDLIKTLQDAWQSFQYNIENITEEFATSVINFFYLTVEKFKKIYEECKQSFFDILYDILSVLKQVFNNFLQDILRIRDFVSNAVSTIWNKIKEFLNKILDKWEKIKNTILGYFNTVKQWIINHEIYIKIKSWILYAKNAIIRFWKDFWEIISHHISELRKAILENEDSIIGYVVKYFQKAYATLKLYINKFIQHPVVVFFVNMYHELYYKIQWFLTYYNLKTNIITLSFRVYQQWVTLLQHTGYQRGNKFDTRNEVLFLPTEGQIKATQYLPFPWYALTKSPHFHQMLEVRMYETIKRWFYRSKSSFWELVLAYKPYLDRKRWFPPFPVVAIQNGRQHFVTFDGLYHSFVGECTYLLAHDFITKNFTVAINYDTKSSEKSFLLILNGKELELTSDSKILINGKNIELPQKIGEMLLIKDRSVVFAFITKGVVFQCNLHFQICSLSIDGPYFGKTFGLFGTYNNEPSDDLYNDGKQTEEFAAAFDVGSVSCKSHHNRAVNLLTHKIPDTPPLCLFYYQNQNSQFRYCFNQVNPEPYLKMCINDVHMNPDPEMAICSSAKAYEIACKHFGTSIGSPRNCVQCMGLNDTVILEGDNITVYQSDVKRSVDVVILVEGNQCNKDIAVTWPDLIKSIEDELIKENFIENRYSVVGFGNDHVFEHPHSHTADGEIFGNEKTILYALNNMEYGDGGSDVFEALRFATNLPFRIGVLKIFIGIICTKCDSTSKTINYPEIQFMLKEYNIPVHLLLKYDFKIRKQKDFYGIDKTYAYTVKDAGSKSVKGDKELRRQVAVPKYLCIPLALESNGTVFSTTRLLDGKRKTKRFLDVFSRRVAMSAQIPSCQSCDCVSDNYHVGKIHCQNCFISGFYDENMDYEGQATQKLIKNKRINDM